MTEDEILTSQLEKKATSKLYRAESNALNGEIISDIVSCARQELTAATDRKDRVSLTDAATLKSYILKYLDACSMAQTLPSTKGLSRCLGCTSRAIDDFLLRNPASESGILLQMFKDTAAQCLSDASLKNACNSIVSIFLLKAQYDYVDKTSVSIAPATDPLGSVIDPAEIAEKYGYLVPADVEGDT